jgi:hypothetical protein
MYEPDEPKDDVDEDGHELGSPSPGEVFTDDFNPYEPVMIEGADGMPVEQDPPWSSEDAAPIPLTPQTVACLAQPKSHWNLDGVSACRHYRRQRVHNPKAPDRPMIQRFCCHPFLRGINGACLSLDDAGIFECEFRTPEDKRAILVLNGIDSVKVRKGQERLVQEKKTGKTHGYRLFRTPEDVKAGRFVLDENDTSSSGDVSPTEPAADPFASDDVPPCAEK